jgi:hypothetical protein
MSGGQGGKHYVVLLGPQSDGVWSGAVIESCPAKPLFLFSEPNIANRAGVHLGSGIRLPVALIPAARIGDKIGAVAEVTVIKIEIAIADAISSASG